MAGAGAGSAGVGEMGDRLAILQLEAEYARTWDLRDADGWAGCFTPDGAFELGPVRDAPPVRFVGAAVLADFCRRATKRYEGIHLLSAPSLTITGAAARGWVHFQYFDRDRRSGARRHVVGVYAVTYACDDGTWRMRLRREQAVMIGDDFLGVPSADVMWDPAPWGLDRREDPGDREETPETVTTPDVRPVREVAEGP